MNKIKSERAKDYLLNNSAHRDSKEGKEMGVVTTYLDATKAVLVAEKDAEERAMQAFEEAIRQISPLCYMPIDREQWRKSFKNLLNGGQSDE